MCRCNQTKWEKYIQVLTKTEIAELLESHYFSNLKKTTKDGIGEKNLFNAIVDDLDKNIIE